MKTVLAITSLLLLLCSFVFLETDATNPVLGTDQEIKSLLDKLSDSTAIKNEFGTNFELEVFAQYTTTTSGCYQSNWIEMNYPSRHFTLTNSTISNSKPVSATSIMLNSNCGWSIKNHLVDHTKFKDLKKEKGLWVEFSENDNSSRFGKVTPFVIYYTEIVSKHVIDSLKLDYESPKQIERYFGEHTVRQIKLSDNSSFLKHLKR